MSIQRTRFTVTMALAIVCMLAFASSALGAPEVVDPTWATTGSGFTHKNAMAKAMQVVVNRGGANWVDEIAIQRSIYPDTVFRDNIDHNANWWGSYPSYYNKSWGSRFGNPQGKVQMYYNEVVKDLRAGDRIGASKNMGYLSHYLQDINGPLHTQESKTEDNALHTNLESDASNSSYGSYISDDGYQYYGGQSSPSNLVVANANSSHAYYSDLVSTYDSHGFNSSVRDIEGHNFNRGVNSIADLIQSAWSDADSVSAVIDSVSPSVITTGVEVTFTGHGVDALHPIAEWRWRSNRDGQLSISPMFKISSLSMGIHNIYFIVRCDGPKWSAETFRPIVVGAQGTKPRAVYRFFNVHTGVHFYTASETERQTVQTTLASTYKLEGIGYALDTSSTVNVAPLYRFFDYTRGVHFLTADEAEKTNLQTNLTNVYRYDGIVAYVSKTNAPGNGTIYRFYNFRKGVHFYTASLAERDMVIARLGETYRYEGPAYYYDPPW